MEAEIIERDELNVKLFWLTARIRCAKIAGVKTGPNFKLVTIARFGKVLWVSKFFVLEEYKKLPKFGVLTKL